ncbi:hypothetical protein KC207_15000 [Phycicoccus sp. BSK3Z-2]|uniref:AMIN-like domain-containing protein n=1 Tax=Phycicoccus avicenniae TaxID=2828860 RepID=A0A941DCS5_9MICO|nr:hypothetical protein [Phycicoccus avicenniae]MBR7744602.1 hypothetical protein [Phycicoccus avicenniae]
MTGPSRRRRTTAVVGAALVLAVTAGCGDGDEDLASTTDPAPTGSSASPSPSASDTESASPSASPSPSLEVPEGFGTEEQASDSWPELGPRVGVGTAVRVGRHEGYDRVVYEFSGSGLPTYQVEWVDEPVQSGSGNTVEVPGDAYLSVRASTVEIPTDSQPQPQAPGAGRLDGTVVASAEPIWGGFEGYGETFVGVTGEERPFRVLVLEEPTRLVVDVWR